MPYRKSFSRVLAALLALALLSGCSAAAPTAPTEEPAVPTEAAEPSAVPEPEASAAPQLGQRDVHVSTVDELLAAIAPNTTIWLAKGDYDLTAAENYGKTPDGVGDAGFMSIATLVTAVVVSFLLELLCEKRDLKKLQPFAMPLAMFIAMGTAVVLNLVLPDKVTAFTWWNQM